MSEDKIISRISKMLTKKFTNDVFDKIKTKNGATQDSERSYKKYIKDTLDELNLSFTEAGTQQSKDYRLDCGIIIEVKKTDSKVLKFNDSYINPNVYYIFINTKYKKIMINKGIYLLDKNELDECIKLKELLRTLDIKGKNKKMTAYIRPNFSYDMKHLL